ncbi:MAG: sigma-70 family RNA polymerase sigma factor [Jatrophihabitans sp.]
MTIGQTDELLRELHACHAPALWSYVLGLTNGDRARAEDVVQETMLRAWRNPQVLDESRGSPRGWLFTVARRIVIDEWRSSRSRNEITTDDVPQVPVADRTDEILQSWLVADALHRLSDDHRAVIVACYYRGRSVDEAAAELGIPAGTVKSRCHYALRALKNALDEMGVTR